MAEVVLEGVTKVFPGGVTAVDRLDLDVGDREFLVLVGPSGCGKSTTLRMIAGLEDASTGTIRIGRRVVNDVPPKDRNIAMVFQNYALYPHMTVYKNMAFGLELRYGGGFFSRAFRRLARPALAAELAVQRRGIGDRVREAARVLGIEALLNRMPRQLSGGERQRVALGRAIVRNPAAFLFDEPLSNLDAKLRVEMRRELKRLHRSLSATMIYVTHDQVEALTLGQRIAVMDQGKIQQIATPQEVYDRPRNRFVAGFIGSPPMNFLTGRLTQRQGMIGFEGQELNASLEQRNPRQLRQYIDREIILGVRPQDVTTVPPEAAAAARATVSASEPLGDATILHLELAPLAHQEKNSFNTLLCKSGARTSIEPGATLGVEIDVRRIHLFDPQSGENITLDDGLPGEPPIDV